MVIMIRNISDSYFACKSHNETGALGKTVMSAVHS